MPSQLLPPNSTLLERAIADATAFDLDTNGLRHAESAALCPPQLLPWLAWERSVDDWDDDWPVAVQRRAVANSVQLHQRKGTVWAVKQALAITGYRARITEWWQRKPAGTPHTFAIDVEVADRGISTDVLSDIERRIDSVKPVRSHYSLRLLASAVAPVHARAVTLSGDVVTVMPYSIAEIQLFPVSARSAIGTYSYEPVNIYPREIP